MFCCSSLILVWSGFPLRYLNVQPAWCNEDILAVFNQHTLFRRLHTLRVSPYAPDRVVNTQYAALGIALAKLPALTALDLGLWLDQVALSDIAWRLPLLRRLRIGPDHYADVTSIRSLPVIRAPNLEVFEATGLALGQDVLHRVFDIAIASQQLKSLRIAETTKQPFIRANWLPLCVLLTGRC